MTEDPKYSIVRHNQSALRKKSEKNDGITEIIRIFVALKKNIPYCLLTSYDAQLCGSLH